MSWRYLEHDGVSASSGLAIDETLMRTGGPLLRLYTYRSHCALVGKFQHLEAEIDVDFCRANAIAVNRRPTGGGAILMGADQLGIALVDSSTRSGVPEHPKEIFARYGRALLAGLERLGVRGALEAKNDLRVNGRKIAGLGVCRDESGAFLFHTSLLVDLDVDLMLRVLKVPAEKLSDKLRERVADNLTTVRRELGRGVTMAEVREAIRAGFAASEGTALVEDRLDPAEIRAARELERDKYLDPAWIDRRLRTPDMAGSSLRKTRGGLLRLYLSLAGERIKDVSITGDFVGATGRVVEIEKRLSSIVAEEPAIRDAVRGARATIGDVMPGVEENDLVPAILDAVAEARKHASQGGAYGCFVDAGGTTP
jgi:lipoate---protein ligase